MILFKDSAHKMSGIEEKNALAYVFYTYSFF